MKLVIPFDLVLAFARGACVFLLGKQVGLSSIATIATFALLELTLAGLRR